AAQRSAEIRSRPPTKSQLKNLMMTYLKNMGGYKYSQLKAKTFAEIQGLYERQKKVIDDFKPMDSDDAVYKKKKDGIHLQKKTLERMSALRLITECESKVVFDLLRFIQKQIDESGSHDGSKKDL
nr:hypothetical protein [Tanacetum cinerariifolium]